MNNIFKSITINFFKELGAFVARSLVFVLITCVISFVCSILIAFAALFGVFKILPTLSAISIYLPFALCICFALGLLMRFFSNSDWHLYGSILFCVFIFTLGTVFSFTSNFSNSTFQVLSVPIFGVLQPLYMFIYEIFRDAINDMEYVFIAAWFLVSVSIFFGLRYAFIPKPIRMKLNIAAAIFFTISVISINAPMLINEHIIRIIP